MLNAVHQVKAHFSRAGRPITVHAVPCGTVTIKQWHHTGPLPEWTPAPVRFAAILANRRFAAPLPIWAYVIETPDAVVVIDTGADPSYVDHDSWRGHDGTRRLLHSFVRLEVTPSQALPARLAAVGLAPTDVNAVVLTHQHIDHTGTVPAFPGAEVWTTAAEDRAARTIGAVRCSGVGVPPTPASATSTSRARGRISGARSP